jgi:hypothetical protein
MEGLQPRYNLAPCEEIPLLRLEDGERVLTTARWGLVPHWAAAGSMWASFRDFPTLQLQGGNPSYYRSGGRGPRHSASNRPVWPTPLLSSPDWPVLRRP